MQALVRSRISTYSHPTVAMQFFETVTRYADFFKVRKEYILPALEAFLDARYVFQPCIYSILMAYLVVYIIPSLPYENEYSISSSALYKPSVLTLRFNMYLRSYKPSRTSLLST